jgi:xanthine dehydrogenase accessory factor
LQKLLQLQFFVAVSVAVLCVLCDSSFSRFAVRSIRGILLDPRGDAIMIDPVLDQLEELRQGERRVAMATLVATRGTTPKREGAKMWVGEAGRVLGSVTIGGCVDVRVIEEAERTLAGGRPRLLSMTLGDEDAWALGFTCGGQVDVLVEPVDLSNTAAYEMVRDEVAAGRRVAIVTRLAEPFARMLVREDGTRIGSLDDETLDRAACATVEPLLRAGTSRTVALRRAPPAVDAFVEVHVPPETLVVIGAGDVAVPLVRMAKMIGLRTIVVDARERFATRERFPDADEIRVGIPSEIVGDLALGGSTYVVLVVHDYKHEVPVLTRVLDRPVAYIGLLGSRRRGQAVQDFLAEQGVATEALARIHVPIGLDIGARTTPEIAVSILAEVLAQRAARNGAVRG